MVPAFSRGLSPTHKGASSPARGYIPTHVSKGTASKRRSSIHPSGRGTESKEKRPKGPRDSPGAPEFTGHPKARATEQASKHQHEHGHRAFNPGARACLFGGSGALTVAPGEGNRGGSPSRKESIPPSGFATGKPSDGGRGVTSMQVVSQPKKAKLGSKPRQASAFEMLDSPVLLSPVIASEGEPVENQVRKQERSVCEIDPVYWEGGVSCTGAPPPSLHPAPAKGASPFGLRGRLSGDFLKLQVGVGPHAQGKKM
ncbi:hypothetical protein M569_06098, partial [Genlisea aurea]